MSDRQASKIDPASGSEHVILPGATIGMVGGGQLGRMFAMAAARMGYRVGVFCGSSDEPAAEVAAFTVCGPLTDHSAIEAFAKRCDVITLEFENIPADTIAACSKHAPTYPDASVLAMAQDRWIEKTTLREAGIPVAGFEPVYDRESAIAAGESLGWPIIVKTCRSGYDGKGQHRLNSPDEAALVQWEGAESGDDGQPPWVAEALVLFEREASVIVARTLDQRVETFPVFENDHQNHILDETKLPANVSPELQLQAREIATRVAEHLGLVGLLCVELFVTPDELIVNEVAPRPHNSGHVTIEACATSQFEQHVRAICGLPLGDTSMVVPAASMLNLLGDIWEAAEARETLPNWGACLDTPGVALHLYGKHAARAGRKMGHLSAVGSDLADVSERLRLARERLLSDRG
ncbi:Phosphoribosylaminoimidazole carboxylase ATPase subunit [Rhodopirellula islandica]|uniref:N5-carboxyaminoimidazole ribonucleotide synthase n=1 Tax=Rhodopirellula islandica TaxID=595434 RepID=A0A0J1BI76_RHOIS|nr:5-(carboxyamino)imidazole ribonucleotide synthase [Rhodopirellula islandica]KLU06250.1 Phosphoribosylaminoimidazole carboxylase ATPase subunit [Rhodopirellula islandica]